MNHIPSFEEFLNESTKYSIDDFQIGDVLHMKDGEAWEVVKAGLRGSGNRKASDEITVYPYNKLAKDRNVKMSIDLSIKYLNDNVTKIEKQ
jgi:hypothetical protein